MRIAVVTAAFLVALVAGAPCAAADDGHDHEALRDHVPIEPAHGHADHGPPLLRRDWCRGWRECWTHGHGSPCGTPYVHSFLSEPAFAGRDVFLDVSRAGGETEWEAELEYALTRRLNLVAELPFTDNGTTSGIGDGALGLRALLVETERLLFATGVEVEVPLGDETRRLGRGEWALAANAHAWTDLGKCFTLQSQIGLEGVPATGEIACLWSVSLIKSFPLRPLLGGGGGHDHGGHGPRALSLHAEVRGETGLAGDEAGETEGLWLVGATLPILDGLDARSAFTRTFEGVAGWRFGIVVHL